METPCSMFCADISITVGNESHIDEMIILGYMWYQHKINLISLKEKYFR